jgi:hypothetical protein
VSLISGFTNQTAKHEVRTGKDGFNRPVYGAVRTIKVRREPASGVIRSATGTDVAVESHYITEAVVAVEDRIDGSPVRRVSELINKGGAREGFEAWT